jgi:hypothetical protein
MRPYDGDAPYLACFENDMVTTVSPPRCDGGNCDRLMPDIAGQHWWSTVLVVPTTGLNVTLTGSSREAELVQQVQLHV